MIQNIPNFTPQFNKIARKHGFIVANKTGKRVKDLTTKAKTPLGDKNSHVIYNIPCGCNKYSYTGETSRRGLKKKSRCEEIIFKEKGGEDFF